MVRDRALILFSLSRLLTHRQEELQNFRRPAFFVLRFFSMRQTVSHECIGICKKIQNSVFLAFLPLLDQQMTYLGKWKFQVKLQICLKLTAFNFTHTIEVLG